MARTATWTEFKDYVHSKGFTLQEFSDVSGVSMARLRRCYCGEIDKELDLHIMNMLKDLQKQKTTEYMLSLRQA